MLLCSEGTCTPCSLENSPLSQKLLTSTMSFFGGTVPEAVAESRVGFKPLVVLLAGQDAEGDAVARELLDQAEEEHLASCILLRLEDDLGNTDPSQFRDAKSFRAFCPVPELPAVVMVSPAGAALATLCGQQLTDAGALRQALTAAFAQVKQQQAAFLAAKAFAALAQRAAAGAPTPAPGGAAGTQQAQQVPAAAPQEQMGEGPPDTADTLMQQGAEDPGCSRAALAATSQPRPTSTLPDADLSGGDQGEGAAPLAQGSDGEQGSPKPGVAGTAAASGVGAGDADMTEAAGKEGAAGQGDRKMSEAAEEEDAGMAGAAGEEGAAAREQAVTLQLRFTDGSVLRSQFSALDPLAAVFAAIDTHRADAARAVPAMPAAPPPYVLVLPQPQAPRQFGPAEEGLTLGALGLGPRTSLAVVPNPQGHKPPTPPSPPPSPEHAQQQQVAAGEQRQVTAGDGVEQTAVAATTEAGMGEGQQAREADGGVSTAVEPPKPEQQQQQQQALKLHIRLPQGPPLVQEFPPGSTLAEVLAAVDAHMAVGAAAASGGKMALAPGPYVLAAPHLGRQFGPGEAGSSLEELEIEPRTSLTLLPSAVGHHPARGPAAAGGAAAVEAAEAGAAAGTGAVAPADRRQQQQQQEAAGAAGPSQQAAQQAKQPPPEPAVPAVITLQFRQPDGGTLRGDFAPDATLQQIFHYVDTHRTDGGGAYTLVQPYPRRQFGTGGAPGSGSNGGSSGGDEMGQSLLQLGLGQRSLLIMELVGGAAHAGGGSSWSVGGLLSYLNPMAYLRTQHSGPSSAQQAQQAAAPPEEALEPGTTEGAGVAGAGRGGTRKRGLGQMGGGSSNIHTLGREEEAGGQAGARGGEGHNSYWNGNSTAFGGDGPEDKGGK